MKIAIRHSKRRTLRSDSFSVGAVLGDGPLVPVRFSAGRLNQRRATAIQQPTSNIQYCAASTPRTVSAFTLLEVLLAVVILAMVMVVVHAIFHGALSLRNKTDEAFEAAIPLQHTLAVIKRDLSNIAVPGGTLSGTFQTTLTAGSTASSTMHYGQQVGPSFYTASGNLSDDSTWSEMRKVTYYLMPATNGGSGLDLVRSVTRNLLPVSQEEYSDQRLLGGVNNLTFQYFNGSAWVDTWDSTTTSLTSSTTNTLPQGIRVQLTLEADPLTLIAPTPIEMVVPITVQTGTNSTSTATGGDE